MTPEGTNELFPVLRGVLQQAQEPLDCNQLYDMAEVRAVAASANRVSDYLGVMFRRGDLSRVASGERGGGARARWKYIWKAKDAPAWKTSGVDPTKVVEYKPKAILDRPSIYITEEGGHIHIEMPQLSITIKVKP